MTPSEEQAEASQASVAPTASAASWFARIWALGLAALLLATLPLWSPMAGSGSGFPRVTWFGLPESSALMTAMEYAALGAVIVALGVVLYDGRRRRAWFVIGAALGALVLMDQHRLQPWVYQSLLYSIVLGGMPWREARRWLIAIAISIYLFSACGKLDYQFVHTVGHQMVQTLARPLGGLDEASATRLAFILPLGELSIAALLVFPKTRRIGGYCAIAMHLTLIAMLGPWSLNHSLGVLTWNALLAAQSWILFCRKPSPGEIGEPNRETTATELLQWSIRLIVAIALLAPLTERSGYWDHWTSWALYSPHNSRAEIQIHQSAFETLPAPIQTFLAEDTDGDRWRDLDIEQWSLQQRRVPIYPQARYQLAFAAQFAKQNQLDQAIRVKVKRVSDRWTGARNELFLIGQSELQNAMNDYWLVVK